MAQRVRTILVDDIDGTELEDAQSISFSYRGTDYEIDLSANNANTFNAAMSQYLSAARRAAERPHAHARHRSPEARIGAPFASGHELTATR